MTELEIQVHRLSGIFSILDLILAQKPPKKKEKIFISRNPKNPQSIPLPCKVSPMADFAPPSFSLGFDLDLDSEPQTSPRPETSTSYNVKPAKRTSAGAPPLLSNKDGDDDDDDFETPTMGFGPKVSDPPQTLKRLCRRPTLPARNEESKEDWFNVDDEIEEFSSQEGPPTGEKIGFYRFSLLFYFYLKLNYLFIYLIFCKFM